MFLWCRASLESFSFNASCTSCRADRSQQEVVPHLRLELTNPRQTIFLYGNVTPLECAAAHGHTDAMKLLMQVRFAGCSNYHALSLTIWRLLAPSLGSALLMFMSQTVACLPRCAACREAVGQQPVLHGCSVQVPHLNSFTHSFTYKSCACCLYHPAFAARRAPRPCPVRRTTVWPRKQPLRGCPASKTGGRARGSPAPRAPRQARHPFAQAPTAQDGTQSEIQTQVQHR